MTMTPARPAPPGPGADAAGELAAVVTPLFGGELPVRLRAWDGSVAGPVDAPTVVVRDAAALRRIVYRPGELGLAQAYVTGELDVEGDLLDGFRRVWRTVRERGASPRLGASTAARPGCGPRGVSARSGRPPGPPASQARLRGRLHSRPGTGTRSRTTTTSPTSSTR